MIGVRAELGGHSLGTFSDEIADALAVGNQLDGLDHGFGIAELEFDAAGIFIGEEALLVAFHRESDGDAAGNGIHGVGIADLVRLADGLRGH